MAQYIESLSAILAIELQQTVPCKKVPEPSNQPTRNHDRSDGVCTAREAVDSYMMTHGVDYEGRAHEDVYITAGLLAEVVGFSKETARRRLKYFEDQGVVETTLDDGYRNYYELTGEFSALKDENIRSQTEVADIAKKLLTLAEEE